MSQGIAVIFCSILVSLESNREATENRCTALPAVQSDNCNVNLPNNINVAHNDLQQIPSAPEGIPQRFSLIEMHDKREYLTYNHSLDPIPFCI